MLLFARHLEGSHVAVFTDVTDDEFLRFMADYDLGDVLSFKGITEGVENTNYAVLTDQAPFILTLYEKRISAEDLPFYLGLMDHLASCDIPCPVPIVDRFGQKLKQLAGRPAALFSFVPGLWPRRIEPIHCHALGNALARLHHASTDYDGDQANDLGVHAWRGILESAGDQVETLQAGLKADLLAELDFLEANWPDHLPSGVIHADLFADNVFFKDDEITGIIDFYFACRDAYAYDLAICLNAWCFERDLSFNVTKARRLLTSYHRIRPLQAVELKALPMLCRGAAMRFLVTRLYDWLHTPADAQVVRKDPFEYLTRLKFHTAVRPDKNYGVSSYGVEDLLEPS